MNNTGRIYLFNLCSELTRTYPESLKKDRTYLVHFFKVKINN